MAIRGVSLTITFTAWNTNTNAGQTGDAGNFTLKWVKDGTSSTATNTATEIDSTNAPGQYKLTLTSTEMTCDTGTLAGKSSTGNVVLIPVQITTEHGVLPTTQQGNAGAVLTAGTGTAQLNVNGGQGDSNILAINGINNPLSGYVSANARKINGTDINANSAQIGANIVGVSGFAVQAFNGYVLTPDTLNTTSINTVTSQTVFTLTAGSINDNTYNGCLIIIQNGSQIAVGVIKTYTGSTKTITLLNDPAIYTFGGGETVYIIANRSLKPTIDNRTLDVSSTGGGGIDWANVKSPTTSLNLSNTTIATTQSVVLGSLDSFVLANGTATAGSSSTITLQTALGADNLPNGNIIKIYSGTGAGQTRGIIGYVNSTKVTTVDRAWTTNPDSTSVYAILSYNYADTPGTTTLLTRIPGTIQPQTGDSYVRLGAPVNADISHDIASVKTDTTKIGTNSGDSANTVTAQNTISTNLNATVSSRLPTASYTTPPTTAAIATAILVTPANKLATDVSGNVVLTSAGLDNIVVETGVNARQLLAVVGAACGGVMTGGGTSSIVFQAAANSGTTRINATVDATGNRSSVTLTLP